MIYTKLFLRFIKENKIYIPIMKHFGHANYFYDGCVEDKLNRERKTVNKLFPMPMSQTWRTMPNTKASWIDFLKDNKVEGNIIPNQSENWNQIPDKLFDEFYNQYKDLEEYKEIFYNVHKLRIKHNSLCRYLRTKTKIIDELFHGQNHNTSLTALWVDFLDKRNISAVIY